MDNTLLIDNLNILQSYYANNNDLLLQKIIVKSIDTIQHLNFQIKNIHQIENIKELKPFLPLIKEFLETGEIQKVENIKNQKYKLIKRIPNTDMLIIKCPDCDVDLVTKTIDMSSDSYKILLKMSEIGIAPLLWNGKCCKNIFNKNTILVEKMDGVIRDIWRKMDKETRNKLFIKINKMIQTMHDMDIGHGDLHEDNIMFKYINGSIEPFIIDWNNSYYISTGATNPIVTQWRNARFPEFTYEEFVEHDFKWPEFL